MTVLEENAKKVLANLKKGIKEKLYILHGEDCYTLQKFKKQLLKYLVGKTELLLLDSVLYFEKDVTLSMIEQALWQTQFSFENNVVLLHNANFINENNQEEWLLLLKGMQEGMHIVMHYEQKLDKRVMLYKILEKSGKVIEFNKLKNIREITWWLEEKLKVSQKRMNIKGKNLFVELFSMQEVSIGFLEQEWEKILVYVGDRQEVETKDLEALNIGNVGILIFRVTDAFWAKDSYKMLKNLKRYFIDNGQIHALIAFLGKQILKVMAVKEEVKQGTWSLHNFMQKKQAEQSNAFSRLELDYYLKELAFLDNALKEGLVNLEQAKERLEQVLLRG